jgi:hypothetical protein
MATKLSKISERMMVLLARGVTTNNVSTSITNRAVKLCSCSQNRTWRHRSLTGDEFSGGITLVSNLFREALRGFAITRQLSRLGCDRDNSLAYLDAIGTSADKNAMGPRRHGGYYSPYRNMDIPG